MTTKQFNISEGFLADPKVSWKSKGFFACLKNSEDDLQQFYTDCNQKDLVECLKNLRETGYAEYNGEKNIWHFSDKKEFNYRPFIEQSGV